MTDERTKCYLQFMYMSRLRPLAKSVVAEYAIQARQFTLGGVRLELVMQRKIEGLQRQSRSI